ncbi:MAG TPA: 3-carboxy-cis,cis-muconate cycloisomerase, partial [Mesorhizobium sp.]|nr:3-carboxy-cis,cis-muconate cycloisomerase [Mesorhizobium sp.]
LAPIRDAISRFEPDIAALGNGAATDGVVVPELVRQLRAATGKPFGRYVHFGATSQDVIDTSLVLRLRSVCDMLARRLDAVDRSLFELGERFGARPLMGRTHMQAAIPITVADRIDAWRAPLLRHRDRLGRALQGLLSVQFGGSAGTLDKFGGKAAAVRAALAEELGLADTPQWHSQRDRIAEFAGVLSLITASLGKFGKDIALMAQAGDELGLVGGGSSSAMPHKQNPVFAELLVTFGLFNAGQLASVHTAMVHEQERSGAAWTLEWLVLPQMSVATGAALRIALALCGSIVRLGPAEET